MQAWAVASNLLGWLVVILLTVAILAVIAGFVGVLVFAATALVRAVRHPQSGENEGRDGTVTIMSSTGTATDPARIADEIQKRIRG